jgi:reactive intermediate/imine deaminase
MKVINSPGIPAVKGHYSPVVEHGGLLYLSGQLPTDPGTGAVPDGIDAQTRLALSKVKVLLEASGSSLNKLLQVRIFLSDISDWSSVNEVYKEVLGDHKPARCIIPVGKLHYGALLEIEAVAFI